MKLILLLMFTALQFVSAPTAKADIEFPQCFPCDPK